MTDRKNKVYDQKHVNVECPLPHKRSLGGVALRARGKVGGVTALTCCGRGWWYTSSADNS